MLSSCVFHDGMMDLFGFWMGYGFLWLMFDSSLFASQKKSYLCIFQSKVRLPNPNLQLNLHQYLSFMKRNQSFMFRHLVSLALLFILSSNGVDSFSCSTSMLITSHERRCTTLLQESTDDTQDFVPSLKTNENGDTFFELSSDRRVTVNQWQGNTRLDIREFYEREGKMLPGKKGLSLTLDQFNILKGFIEDGTLDEIIQELE